MPETRRRRRRRWWSPAWRWRHRSRLRRQKVWQEAGERRRGRKSPRRRLAPLFLLAGGGLFVVLLLAAAVGWRDLSRVRADLVSARDTLQRAVDNPATLRTPAGRAAVRADIDVAVQAVGSAQHRAKRSLVLSATQVVPVVRAQRAGLLSLIDDSMTAATKARDLLAKVDATAARSQLLNGVVPLDGVRELARDARATGDSVAPLGRSASGLWGPLGDARRRFDEVVATTASRLREGADAMDAARSFMGADGPRRYFVAAQNNAEMRDQGATLSYAVLTFDHGRLKIERNGSVQELVQKGPAPTPLPEDTKSVFGATLPTFYWANLNHTADFRLSGRIAADMYRQATGQSVDGVVALDVPALAAMLKVLGPVSVPDFPPVSAANAGSVLLHDAYQGLPAGPNNQVARRERLSDAVRAVADRLTSGSQDTVALGRELGDASRGGHLRLWSRVDDEERVFERTGLGGGPATVDADRTFHLDVQNRTATKLDYYVKPHVRQQVTLLSDGTADVRTTVVVDNQAPVGAAPSYQLGPDEFTKAPGDYIAWVMLWGPAGSPQTAGVPESGLTLSRNIVPVPAGQKRELMFETVIRHAVKDGKLTLRLVPQPRLEPMDLELNLQADGWSVAGPPRTWTGAWDRVIRLTWRVGR